MTVLHMAEMGKYKQFALEFQMQTLAPKNGHP